MYVGGADDSLTQAWVEVFRMDAEKEVARLPELVGGIQEFCLNERRGSIVAEIRLAIAIDSVATVDVPGSVGSHDFDSTVGMTRYVGRSYLWRRRQIRPFVPGRGNTRLSLLRGVGNI
jgi:hypothetical protein